MYTLSVEKQVTAMLADAKKNWPKFTELEPSILNLLKTNPHMSLYDVYKIAYQEESDKLTSLSQNKPSSPLENSYTYWVTQKSSPPQPLSPENAKATCSQSSISPTELKYTEFKYKSTPVFSP